MTGNRIYGQDGYIDENECYKIGPAALVVIASVTPAWPLLYPMYTYAHHALICYNVTKSAYAIWHALVEALPLANAVERVSELIPQPAIPDQWDRTHRLILLGEAIKFAPPHSSAVADYRDDFTVADVDPVLRAITKLMSKNDIKASVLNLLVSSIRNETPSKKGRCNASQSGRDTV